MRLFVLFCMGLAISLLQISLIAGQEPGWTNRIIVPGYEEAARQATPIIERPYRPLHFYGNTIRRMHYHGRVRPTLPELRQGFQVWASRG